MRSIWKEFNQPITKVHRRWLRMSFTLMILPLLVALTLLGYMIDAFVDIWESYIVTAWTGDYSNLR